MFRKLFLSVFLLFSLMGIVRAEDGADYRIIISTPGYMSVYNYTKPDFLSQAKEQFRIMGDVAINEDDLGGGKRRIYVTLGLRQFDFLVTPQTPVIRLSYDRNRRLFTGVGCNFIDREGAACTPPTFKGIDLTDLPEKWIDEINRRIGDRTLLSEDAPTVFILELDIDEQGIVHKVVELNGALKQYSQVIIDYIYERAVREWEPAKRNGVPFRALAQLRFELSR